MSFLDRFRRRKPQSESEPAHRTALGMVALRSSIPVSLVRVHGHLLETWADFPRLEDVDADDEAAVIRIPGGCITLGYMPAPIPWGDLEWPVKMAWQWAGAREALEGHQAHLIAFAASDSLSQVELSMRLTQVIAAAIAVTDSAGVYYGHASLVIEPEQYSSQALEARPDQLPVFLWIGFHPVREPGGLSLYTTGMSAFGQLELEAHDTALTPAELLGRLADIAHYQLVTGNRLEDGHTFGATAEERIAVRHRPSRFIAEAVTCQLAL